MQLSCTSLTKQSIRFVLTQKLVENVPVVSVQILVRHFFSFVLSRKVSLSCSNLLLGVFLNTGEPENHFKLHQSLAAAAVVAAAVAAVVVAAAAVVAVVVVVAAARFRRSASTGFLKKENFSHLTSETFFSERNNDDDDDDDVRDAWVELFS